MENCISNEQEKDGERLQREITNWNRIESGRFDVNTPKSKLRHFIKKIYILTTPRIQGGKKCYYASAWDCTIVLPYERLVHTDFSYYSWTYIVLSSRGGPSICSVYPDFISREMNNMCHF